MSNEKKNTNRMIFSEELISLLTKISNDNNYLSFELLSLTDPDYRYHNGLKITKVDISEQDYCFDVTIEGKSTPMKIGKFVKYYFAGIMSDNEIVKFSKIYNKIKSGEPDDSFGTPLEIPEFVYNPKDVRSTFLSMVTKTYPHGHEDEVLKFLPSLEKDKVGNYYKIIGNPNPVTMFTSHLDTADREQKTTKLYSIIEDDNEYIVTDENTILGADDKSGITVMLYMMEHNIPGLYYFFIGEERGGIGSNKLAKIYDEVDYLKDIKRCVSFDRRNYYSVITKQLGRKCCSDEFGTALANEFNKSGLELSLDPTGIYTDSASFIDEICECTNISVGYFHEHTGEEYQNITYLESLCKASVSVNWNSLPTVRKIGFNNDITNKYKDLISDIKASVFDLEIRFVSEDGRVFIRIDFDVSDISTAHSGLISLSSIMNRYKVNQDLIFDENFIKIELK
jgi:hypothetical protein